MKEKRIIFMGTPSFAEMVLRKIVEANYNVVAVVTQPDRKVGRKQVLTFSEVKKYALSQNILLLQPERISSNLLQLKDLQPDLIITCAYGQFLPQAILELPNIRCINIHASLLPKLRGGAPIHHAIIQGHKKTGISIMEMARAMDGGPVAYQREITITNDDNVLTLHDKLAVLAGDMIVEFLPEILNNQAQFLPQDESLASYAYNISAEDEFISFQDDYQKVYNQIRGLIPWPVGYGLIEDLKIKFHQVAFSNEITNAADGTILPGDQDGIKVAVSNQVLLLKEVQFAGKRKISAQEFYFGQGQNLVGKRFK